MATDKIDILLYADWLETKESKLIGTLSAHQGKGRKIFSFKYHYLKRIKEGMKCK